MALRDLLSMMTSDFDSPRHASEFGAARERHEALAPHDDVRALFAAIGDGPVRRYELCENVLRVAVAEQQLRSSELWSRVLLVLCAPMLDWIRASIRGDAIDADDLDQLVVCAFLEEARALVLEKVAVGQTFAALRSGTRRRVFRRVGQEQADRVRTETTDPSALSNMIDGEPGASEDVWAPAPCPAPSDEDRAEEVAAQTAFLVQHGGVLGEERLDLLVHTHVMRRPLTEYVEDRYGHLSDTERERVYQRDKRRHARAVKVLRDALAPLRHRPMELAQSARGAGGARHVG